MKKILSLLMLCCMASYPLNAQNPGCDGSRYLDNVFPSVKQTTVLYAPTLNHFGQPMDLFMDVYEPVGDNLSSRPVVILAHGGSFITGDRTLMKPWCELLAKKGYIAVSIQYRLFPFLILGFPDSISIFDTAVKATGDMKAAVRFFREDAATANQFRADPSNIFIGGYSAGAVTALHTAYLEEEDQIPTFLQTLVDNNGGFEGISGTASNKTFESHSKAVVNMSGGLYRSFWVDDTESPLVSIHGTADGTVPYTYGLAANIAFLEGSSLVHARAESIGLWNNLITVPGAGHSNLYDPAQAMWKPYVDSFWVNATGLMESITCKLVDTDEPSSSHFENWSLFPNPGTGDGFTIQLPESNLSVDVQVLDPLGKIVFRQKQVGNQQFVSLNQLPKGVYMVQLVHPTLHFELLPMILR